LFKAAAKSLVGETGWLLASYLLALMLMGALVGFPQVWRSGLDIQMHNTYFVFPPAAAGLPLFLPVATLVTLSRATRVGFRLISINLVLGLLLILWFLVVNWLSSALGGIR